MCIYTCKHFMNGIISLPSMLLYTKTLFPFVDSFLDITQQEAVKHLLHIKHSYVGSGETLSNNMETPLQRIRMHSI